MKIVKKKITEVKLERKGSKTLLFDSLGAPERLSFELFLPWIYKIMLNYQDQNDSENEEFKLKDNKFSKGYYTKKVN